MAKTGQRNAAMVELSYSVPGNNGNFLPADPIKFCLRYKPPTIAIVYKLLT